MIVPKDFLNKLKDFGLNSYEANLWTALLSRGVATAGELSDIANVPRSRSYDVLESLERKGFVVMKLGKPIKYIAVPPSEVIERVKKSIKEDADRQSNVIEGLRKSDLLGELSALYTQGIKMIDPVEMTGVVKGRGNLSSHLVAGIKNAQKSVLIMTTEAGLSRKVEDLRLAFAKAKERGVSVKIIAPSKNNSSATKTLAGVAQLKHADSVPARFCSIDGRQITFMVLDDVQAHPNYDFGVWVSSESFTKGFDNIFKSFWDKN
ncbi:hypothetical protein J4219_03050 [Candidatus Woesearchaeota archaeon]|nr:hypothetical protein [Candidatus Woesearchaeota archaeon]